MKRPAISSVFVCLAAIGFAGELDIARNALRDGLWEVARTHAAKVEGTEARLVAVESLVREGRWEDVLKTLEAMPDETDDGFVYYRALALVRLERITDAADLLSTHAFTDSDYVRCAILLGACLAQRTECPEAVLKAAADAAFPTNDVNALSLVAWAKARTGDVAGARVAWRDVLAITNADEGAVAAAATNLGDVESLRLAHGRMRDAAMKRSVGLRLGRELLAADATFDEGSRMIQSLAKDLPDAAGAKDSFLALADACLKKGRADEAADLYRKALEAWPETAKELSVLEGYAWSLRQANRPEEALAAFVRASEAATEAEDRARNLMAQGEALTALGRGGEAMAQYRVVLDKYPATTTGRKLKVVVELGELEAEGRADYRNFNFIEAQAKFAELARRAPDRRPRMEYFEMLCLYGQGRDDEAVAVAKRLAAGSPDEAIRAEATLWLAKFTYNARDWRAACSLFSDYATKLAPSSSRAPSALTWAARASFAAGDYPSVLSLVTRLTKDWPQATERTSAWLIQGEALSQLARLDEAIQVFEKVILTGDATPDELSRARRLKADVLFAMGADNPSRYREALAGYRALLLGESQSPDDRLDINFRIGHTLEKLGKMDEAVDQYYSQVVLAFREQRGTYDYSDKAKGTFARAAFRLADEFERRGEDRQAMNVLSLVSSSGVRAVQGEVKRRLARLKEKGNVK